MIWWWWCIWFQVSNQLCTYLLLICIPFIFSPSQKIPVFQVSVACIFSNLYNFVEAIIIPFYSCFFYLCFNTSYNTLYEHQYKYSSFLKAPSSVAYSFDNIFLQADGEMMFSLILDFKSGWSKKFSQTKMDQPVFYTLLLMT